jgi:hypothetical protein
LVKLKWGLGTTKLNENISFWDIFELHFVKISTSVAWLLIQTTRTKMTKGWSVKWRQKDIVPCLLFFLYLLWQRNCVILNRFCQDNYISHSMVMVC